MAKNSISTGFKYPNTRKVIRVGDVLKIEVKDVPEGTHPLFDVLKHLEYDTMYIQVEKHDWLELDLTAYIMAKECLAERNLIDWVSSGKSKDDFDNEYKETAPYALC